jgi:hypothetical protein
MALIQCGGRLVTNKSEETFALLFEEADALDLWRVDNFHPDTRLLFLHHTMLAKVQRRANLTVKT